MPQPVESGEGSSAQLAVSAEKPSQQTLDIDKQLTVVESDTTAVVTNVSPRLAARSSGGPGASKHRTKLADLENETSTVSDSSQYFSANTLPARPLARRRTLAPPHPRHFVIDLEDSETDSSDEDDSEAKESHESGEPATRATATPDPEHSEALRKEIQRKEAARAELEAKIAAMEARIKARKKQAATSASQPRSLSQAPSAISSDQMLQTPLATGVNTPAGEPSTSSMTDTLNATKAQLKELGSEINPVIVPHSPPSTHHTLETPGTGKS